MNVINLRTHLLGLRSLYWVSIIFDNRGIPQEITNHVTMAVEKLHSLLQEHDNFDVMYEAASIEVDAYHPTEQEICDDSSQPQTLTARWDKWSKLKSTYIELGACTKIIVSVARDLKRSDDPDNLDIMANLLQCEADLTKWLLSIAAVDTAAGAAIDEIFRKEE